MKKNIMLRLASSLLISVMLTTSIIGGTFAKYTTKGTATDIARVAKWGVRVETSSDLFAEAYKDQKVDTTDGSATVKTSVAGQKLVAPGTDGTLLESVVTGTPEVSVTISTSGVLTLTGWEYAPDPAQPAAKEAYCPIVITIDGAEYKMGDAKDETNHVYSTIADFQTAVNTALTKSQNFGPNTNLGTQFSPSVSWKWNIAGNAQSAYQTDDKDTALGNAAAEATAGNEPKIKLDYVVTVTQAD